jgi:ectoine hydroxylase-related dioxygenase (phytanoyl-CoA dioxygenase family)
LSPVLALRIHLDEANAENGPLLLLAGTHSLGVLSDDRMDAFAERGAQFECHTPQGGVLGMRRLLIHASSKSRAEIPRRVLHIEYAASDLLASSLQLGIA